MGRLPASVPRITTSRRVVFRGCRYFVMFRPPSLLAPQIVPTAAILPQGSRGFYVRAYRALLPPHAPDMLTVRRQVIDGTGTCTLLDSQPCRLLRCLAHSAAPLGLSNLVRNRYVLSRLYARSERTCQPCLRFTTRPTRHGAASTIAFLPRTGVGSRSSQSTAIGLRGERIDASSPNIPSVAKTRFRPIYGRVNQSLLPGR